MKPDEILYCFRIEDLDGDGGLLDELLSALDFDHSSWFDRETCRVWHTVYSRTPEQRAAERRRFESELPAWRELGVSIGATEEFDLRSEEWTEAWKKFFKPLEISPRLLVRPDWLDDLPKPGQKLLSVDPGMSFGTGQHPTTLYCLQTIDRLLQQPDVNSLLDAGCGSGILAIAGALLGYDPVDAFDFDPDAVASAKKNLERNNISSVIPTVGDANEYPGRAGGYDLVCANILGHLLRAFRVRISSWVKPGKFLCLAGILNSEFDALSADYAELGFTEIDRCTLKEWTSGLFRREVRD